MCLLLHTCLHNFLSWMSSWHEAKCMIDGLWVGRRLYGYSVGVMKRSLSSSVVLSGAVSSTWWTWRLRPSHREKSAGRVNGTWGRSSGILTGRSRTSSLPRWVLLSANTQEISHKENELRQIDRAHLFVAFRVTSEWTCTHGGTAAGTFTPPCRDTPESSGNQSEHTSLSLTVVWDPYSVFTVQWQRDARELLRVKLEHPSAWLISPSPSMLSDETSSGPLTVPQWLFLHFSLYLYGWYLFRYLFLASV